MKVVGGNGSAASRQRRLPLRGARAHLMLKVGLGNIRGLIGVREKGTKMILRMDASQSRRDLGRSGGTEHGSGRDGPVSAL